MIIIFFSYNFKGIVLIQQTVSRLGIFGIVLNYLLLIHSLFMCKYIMVEACTRQTVNGKEQGTGSIQEFSLKGTFNLKNRN